MSSRRLDSELHFRGLVKSRSEAQSWIKMGKVLVDGKPQLRSDVFVTPSARIQLNTKERYVSRAGLKLASVVGVFGVDFSGKTVLDVGSSTGGFTDLALQHGARKDIAVDIGTDQLHKDLRNNLKVEIHEKTDIRDFVPSEPIEIVLIDVSFISLRSILPHIKNICQPETRMLVMVKPQFEANPQQLDRGVVKNNSIRRAILRDFESWVKSDFVILKKAESEVIGASGNRECFYLLTVAK